MNEHPCSFHVPQEAVTQAGTLGGAFDQTGHVDHHERFVNPHANHAQLRFERRERIIGDFRAGGGNDREQGRLASVG